MKLPVLNFDAPVEKFEKMPHKIHTLQLTFFGTTNFINLIFVWRGAMKSIKRHGKYCCEVLQFTSS